MIIWISMRLLILISLSFSFLFLLFFVVSHIKTKSFKNFLNYFFLFLMREHAWFLSWVNKLSFPLKIRCVVLCNFEVISSTSVLIQLVLKFVIFNNFTDLFDEIINGWSEASSATSVLDLHVQAWRFSFTNDFDFWFHINLNILILNL